MNNYHRTIVDLCEFPNVESWERNIKEFNDLMLRKYPKYIAKCKGIFITFVGLVKISVYSEVMDDFIRWTEEKEHNKRIKRENVLKNQ
jgi:hypothetical protein